MLRDAIIKSLKSSITAIGDRVYQAFLAPPKAKTPYITVKIPGDIAGSVPIVGTQPIEIRIYDGHTSFLNLDLIAEEVTQIVTGDIVDDEGNDYSLEPVFGGGDFADSEKKLIGKLMFFHTASIKERR